jgi:hypothetical protein
MGAGCPDRHGGTLGRAFGGAGGHTDCNADGDEHG